MKPDTSKAPVANSSEAAAPKESKPIDEHAAPPPVAPNLPGEPAQRSLLNKVENKVAGAFKAVADTLTDAEQLHEKLDPGISPEPE
jgi:hypothetical protein